MDIAAAKPLAGYRREDYIFRLFRAYKGVLTSITFWGAADDHTWLDLFPVRDRKNRPLLFDERYAPKPCFWGVVNRNGSIL